MSNFQHKSSQALKVLAGLFILISLASVIGFYFIKKHELDIKMVQAHTHIEKFLIEASNALISPENCLINLQDKDLANDSLDKIINGEKIIFPIGTYLKNSKIKITEYKLNADTQMLAKNKATIEVFFLDDSDDEGRISSEKINLYVDLDQNDRVDYCQSLSTTISDLNEKRLINTFKVKHARHQGALASFKKTKISLAVATCPKGYVLTGCHGTVTSECLESGLTPFHVAPHPLSPNACESQAKATPNCEVRANAIAICLRNL